MDLMNKLPHMRGTSVLVNGCQLVLDADGIARGVPEAVAKKLLNNREAWTPLKSPDRAPTPAPVEPIMAKVATTLPVTPPKPAVEAPVEPEPEVEGVEEKAETPDPEVEDEGEVWPDPDQSMSIAYLRQMADAYGVRHAAKTSKKELVKKLKSAMYE